MVQADGACESQQQVWEQQIWEQPGTAQGWLTGLSASEVSLDSEMESYEYRHRIRSE